ncbi:two-component system, NarL family, sensor histidine kinase BarA [Microdochium nivale]|nr:two-component system, NarL family, sensor histidine kinase BarA [Microdochium nivale]
MIEDWRFRQNPHVEHGGLVAYAGVPLRLRDESGQSVAIGSLCVASKTSQEPLTKTQQSTIARMADWVVSDLVQCTRARRQRVRREMSDLLLKAQKRVDEPDSERHVFEILSEIYPAANVSLQPYKGGDVHVDGLEPIPLGDIEDGIWEDVDFLDAFIAHSNHQGLPTDRIVRLLTVQCESVSGASLLSVTSKDYRHVFDDVDSWFLQSCANVLTSIWQRRLLTEAMKAKERFLCGFSHHLRTPLHVILSSVELLAEEMKTQTLRELARSTPALFQLAQDVDSSGPTVYLDTIKAAGRDLINIVNSMILFNRWADIAAMERKYALHTVQDLEDELAGEIDQVMSSDMRYHTTVFFHHNLCNEDDSFQIDIALLRRSVLPLVVNAIQSTPDGTVVITITLSSESRELAVDVQDNGYGIEDEDQGRIFEPYERAVDIETVGAGLGLSLASKFATLLHGSVELVSSQKERGSHFRAIFRGVDMSSSASPLPRLAPTLNHLPRFFYNPPLVDGTHLSLCAQFSQFLATHGYTETEDAPNAFSFFEYQPEATQSEVESPCGISFCLVSSLHCSAAPATKTDGSIVYITAPFSTSKLRAALNEADKLCAATLGKARQAAESVDDEGAASAERCPSADEAKDEQEIAPSPPLVEPKSAILQLVEDKSQKDHVQEDGPESPGTNLEVASERGPRMPATPPPEPVVSRTPVALLVDDNSVNLRILQMYCNKRRITYYSATDGRQAVSVYRERQALHTAGQGDAISLVLMDLQMPVCDGIDATKQIRQLEQEKQWPRSALFIITGQDGLSDRAAAEEAGADDYFVKPVSIKSLDGGVGKHFTDFKPTI